MNGAELQLYPGPPSQGITRRVDVYRGNDLIAANALAAGVRHWRASRPDLVRIWSGTHPCQLIAASCSDDGKIHLAKELAKDPRAPAQLSIKCRAHKSQRTREYQRRVKLQKGIGHA